MLKLQKTFLFFFGQLRIYDQYFVAVNNIEYKVKRSDCQKVAVCFFL